METLLALIGRKYLKNYGDRMYHHYKCPDCNRVFNTKSYFKSAMMEDLARHPYTVKKCKCLDAVV